MRAPNVGRYRYNHLTTTRQCLSDVHMYTHKNQNEFAKCIWQCAPLQSTTNAVSTFGLALFFAIAM